LDDHTHTGPTTPYKEKDAYYAPGQEGHGGDQLPTVGREFDEKNTNDGNKKAIVTPKSKGVVGMELLLSRMNVKYLVLLYGGFILLSYTLSLGTSWSSPFSVFRLRQLPSSFLPTGTDMT
jgi:SIT family siderophore-iron:H+ symporter-like MFS transporter